MMRSAYTAEAFIDRFLKQPQPNLNRLRRVQRMCRREGKPYVPLGKAIGFVMTRSATYGIKAR